MNIYLAIIIGIVVVFAVITIISIVVAVIKGFRAGETEVEIVILGIIRFSLRLSDISRNREN